MTGPISNLPEHLLSNLLYRSLPFKFDKKNLYYFEVENPHVESLFLFFDYVTDLSRLERFRATHPQAHQEKQGQNLPTVSSEDGKLKEGGFLFPPLLYLQLSVWFFGGKFMLEPLAFPPWFKS